MELESILREAERLIARKQQTDEFVEPELEPIIWTLFDNPQIVTEDSINHVEALFNDLASIKKSTYFGCQFYKRLENTKFPFTQNVLRRAVESEPYYNCNDAALKSYLAVALRETDIPKGVVNSLLRYIPDGHQLNYTNILRAIGESPKQKTPNIPTELKDTLIFAASQDSFEETAGKALCALVYFDIKEIVPKLKNRLKECTQKTSNLTDKQKGERILANLSTTATALEYLTGDKRYRELVDFIKPNIDFLTCQDTKEFIEGLNRRLEEF